MYRGGEPAAGGVCNAFSRRFTNTGGFRFDDAPGLLVFRSSAFTGRSRPYAFSHGLMTLRPAASKGLVSRVATIRPCAAAEAAM